ncbi:MAG TPA: VanZ family protein [Clostridiaceae bacterium]|nr:VanZ family protein [Clostridiaceae bacterium]
MNKFCEKLSKRFDNKTLLLIITNIIWMGVIYYFSSQPANESSQISGVVTEFILKLLNIIFLGNIPQPLKQLITGSNIVRKAGHAVEFFILGVLVNLLVKRLKIKRSTAVASIVCILYAISDEFHQIFVSGRGPSVSDVLLDSISSVAAILLVNSIKHIIFTRKKSN